MYNIGGRIGYRRNFVARVVIKPWCKFHGFAVGRGTFNKCQGQVKTCPGCEQNVAVETGVQGAVCPGCGTNLDTAKTSKCGQTLEKRSMTIR